MADEGNLGSEDALGHCRFAPGNRYAGAAERAALL